MILGVFFDLGGVVFESPFPAIDAFESASGLKPGSVSAMIRQTGRDGPWGRLERGEIDLVEFDRSFESYLGVPGSGLLRRIKTTMVARSAMVEAIERLRAQGFITAAVTNNWLPIDTDDLAGLFDLVVESVREGFNKPDVELYEIALKRAGLAGDQVIVLDDIGRNLKAAQSLGMETIKVDDPGTAIELLETRLGH